MGMKNSLNLMAAALMMQGLDTMSYPHKETQSVDPKNIDVTPKTVIQKGTKKFTIDGIDVYAINEKNAIKKYNKLKQSK